MLAHQGYDVSGSYNKKANHQASRSLPRLPTEHVLSIEAVMDAARVVFQSGPCRERHTDTDDDASGVVGLEANQRTEVLARISRRERQ